MSAEPRPAPANPNPAPPAAPATVCVFYLNGQCTKGEKCAFAHDAAASPPPCKFFAEGRCRNGDACVFAHEKGAQADGPSTPTMIDGVEYAQPGQRPNVQWRCVPMVHLRFHPQFFALPDPRAVFVRSVRDYWRFRQDSWQWLATKGGRVGTAFTTEALAIYEPTSQKILAVPQSLAKHARALGTWSHLVHTVAPAPAELNRDYNPMIAAQAGPPFDLFAPAAARSAVAPAAYPPSELWRPALADSPFRFTYHPPEHAAMGQAVSDPYEARMVWGTTQEATSLLAVVNYFGRQGAQVLEVGSCPAEMHYDLSHLRLPLVASTPDAVVRWPDGTLEAVEVKTHCPFSQEGSRWFVRDTGPHAKLAPWYVPQMMLELYTLGPQCKGSYMFSCSATRGIAILRIKRDEAYLQLMLELLSTFFTKFVLTRQPPPEDYFRDEPRHRAFLEATLAISKAAEVVAVLPEEAVQRSPVDRNFFI